MLLTGAARKVDAVARGDLGQDQVPPRHPSKRSSYAVQHTTVRAGGARVQGGCGGATTGGPRPTRSDLGNRGDTNPPGNDEFCTFLDIGITKPTGFADNHTYHP